MGFREDNSLFGRRKVRFSFILIISVSLLAVFFIINASQETESDIYSGPVLNSGGERKSMSNLNQSANTKQVEEETVAPKEEIPHALNLPVPFTVQAPEAQWVPPFKEACEEAAILNVHNFYQDRILTATEARQEIANIVDWENNYFGYYKDTTAAETGEMMQEYYGYNKVEVIDDPTVKLIKQHIAAGRPVIAPFAGQQLGNPYFTPPGPLYHMLVIRGYDQTYFYTNDVGTRRGDNYQYTIATIMEAMHDWNGGAVATGAKRIIVAYPNE